MLDTRQVKYLINVSPSKTARTGEAWDFKTMRLLNWIHFRGFFLSHVGLEVIEILQPGVLAALLVLESVKCTKFGVAIFP